MKTVKISAIAVLIALGILGSAARVESQSPDAAAPSLQDLLKTQYKVARVGSDSSGFKVLEPGTVVAVKKTGMMATENMGVNKGAAVRLPGFCANTFKNGQLSTKKACSATSLGAKFLPVGDKLYITKFEVKEKENKISFNLVECDTCNGATTPSAMKSEVTFEFAPKFLDTAEPGQITDVIGQLFAPDAGATRAAVSGEAQSQAAEQVPAEPQQAAVPASPTVKMGDTPQQVIAILGNPIGVKPGGGKVVYQYKDFKVVFVGGRVAAVE